MTHAFLVALASELSFVAGFLVGTFLSVLAGFAMAMILNSSRLSTGRALLQGAIIGLVAGASCIWVAMTLGNKLSVPNSWLLWLALAPPLLGQIGLFPLNRLSKVAWMPLLQSVFAHNTLGGDSPTDNIRAEALLKTDWFIRRAFWGVAVGVAISAWYLVR